MGYVVWINTSKEMLPDGCPSEVELTGLTKATTYAWERQHASTGKNQALKSFDIKAREKGEQTDKTERIKN